MLSQVDGLFGQQVSAVEAMSPSGQNMAQTMTNTLGLLMLRNYMAAFMYCTSQPVCEQSSFSTIFFWEKCDATHEGHHTKAITFYDVNRKTCQWWKPNKKHEVCETRRP